MTDSQRYRISTVLIDQHGQTSIPAFNMPLVHQLQPDSAYVHVDVELTNDQLTIQRNDASAIVFRRPTYCPFTNLHLQEKSSMIVEHPSNAIALGVVVLLESADHRVLLTRRASHMRTFPSCWVCPGGGIEQGETLLQAGLRELHEEVGVDVKDTAGEPSELLALWESAFPVDLAHGLPRRHHIVVYIHVRSSKSVEEMPIRIDPSEVDAYTWLSHEQIGMICGQASLSDSARTFNAHVDGKELCALPFEVLTTADYNQSENLTNGTRFALEQLYHLTCTRESL